MGTLVIYQTAPEMSLCEICARHTTTQHTVGKSVAASALAGAKQGPNSYTLVLEPSASTTTPPDQESTDSKNHSLTFVSIVGNCVLHAECPTRIIKVKPIRENVITMAGRRR